MQPQELVSVRVMMLSCNESPAVMKAPPEQVRFVMLLDPIDEVHAIAEVMQLIEWVKSKYWIMNPGVPEATQLIPGASTTYPSALGSALAMGASNVATRTGLASLLEVTPDGKNPLRELIELAAMHVRPPPPSRYRVAVP